MECIRAIGFGGSNQNGAVVLGPSWRDRDCEAERTLARLADLNLYGPAATAYCARPRHAAPFGGREICETQVAQALIEADMPEQVQVREVYVPDSQCREALGRCEAAVGK